MVDRINEKFVGVDIDSGGHWSFVVPSGISRISEGINRFEIAAHELFASSDGFVRPTEIEYSIRTYSTDGRVRLTDPQSDTGSVKLNSVRRKTITDKNGLVATDIPFNTYAQYNQKQDEMIRFIGDIEFTQTQTHIALSDYDGWLDRTDKQYVKPARRGEVLKEQVKHDPIEIQLYHMAGSAQTAGPDMSFVISVTTSTDIWFEETAIGQTNQRRLETFFEHLFSNFDIVDVSISPRQIPDRELRALLPDNP